MGQLSGVKAIRPGCSTGPFQTDPLPGTAAGTNSGQRGLFIASPDAGAVPFGRSPIALEKSRKRGLPPTREGEGDTR